MLASEENAEGRWRKFTYEEILARDKVSLDIFWLRDDSLGDMDNLPEPDEIADVVVVCRYHCVYIGGHLWGGLRLRCRTVAGEHAGVAGAARISPFARAAADRGFERA
jgi:hypothetical protein